MRTKPVLLAGALGGLLFVAAIQSQGAGYDLSHDFSSIANPSGVWSYGFKSNLTSALVPFTVRTMPPDDNGLRIVAWSKNGFEQSDIFFNQTTNTAISEAGAGVYPPGTVIFHPGIEGHPDNFGTIRFTAPVGAGQVYRVSSTVATYLDGAASHDADYHVVYGGLEIHRNFMAPNSSDSFSTTIYLVGGETLDFMVGRGADGLAYGSGLKASVHLDAVNLPDSVAIAPEVSQFADTVLVGLKFCAFDADIHFTLDGTKPGTNSPVYTGPMILTNSTTVSAQAFVGLVPVSEVSTHSYRRNGLTREGISEDWLIRYFGPDYASDPRAAAYADPDGDTISNYQEFLYGTDPLDSHSTPFIASLRAVPEISWVSASGTVYRIQRRYLGAPDWTDLSPTVAATNSVTRYLDEGATNSALYRIQVVGP